MTRRRFLVLLSTAVLLLALVGGARAQGPVGQGEAGAQAALGTAFTYQGRLTEGGSLAGGSYDLRFILYNAAAGGAQIGGIVTQEDVALTEGLFSVALDFGPAAFTGQARYLEVAVRVGDSTGAYTTLSPRQALTATPYALHALSAPWTGLSGVPTSLADGDDDTTYTAGAGLRLSSDEFSVAFGGSGSASAVSRSDHDHLGQTWVGSDNPLVISGTFNGSTSGAPLILGNAFSTGYGLTVEQVGLAGVYVKESRHDGLQVHSAGDDGVSVGLVGGDGMYVAGAGHNGLHVFSADDDGVYVRLAGAPSTRTASTGSNGFEVSGAEGDGLYIGRADDDGVSVRSAGDNGIYVFSVGGWAGYFNGDVAATGSLVKGGGSFKIDHPLDPEARYLSHSFVESPDMMNVYNGNVTTDEEGFATVRLPDYFEALNRDYRYQLTVIGAFAQAIVAQEVEDNRFVIQTDQPEVKVSWQVTGIRNDPWAEANRVVVEEDKPPEEQDTYLHPQAYGQPETRGLAYREAQEEEAERPEEEK
jgi:hypothetical protein